MVRITEDLLRRKAEANNGVLRTLRELALHQQGIETIELLNQHCRHLRVLYLHNNIISKIEGLHRLKVRKGWKRWLDPSLYILTTENFTISYRS